MPKKHKPSCGFKFPQKFNAGIFFAAFAITPEHCEIECIAVSKKGIALSADMIVEKSAVKNFVVQID